MNKLMDRIFTAVQNQEDVVLDQISSDITDSLFSDSLLVTDQYNIVPTSKESVVILDKVNDQLTHANVVDGQVDLISHDEVPTELIKGCHVLWMDNDSVNRGICESCEGDSTKVILNGTPHTIETSKIVHLNSCPCKCKVENPVTNISPMKSVNTSTGEVIAFSNNEDLLNRISKLEEGSEVKAFSLSAYEYKLNKSLSKLSESTQRLFTRSNRRYVVLDETGDLKYVTNLGGARAAIADNPGYACMKIYKYNQLITDNVQGQELVAQKEFTKTNHCSVVLDDKGKFVGIYNHMDANGVVLRNPGYSKMRLIEYNKTRSWQ